MLQFSDYIFVQDSKDTPEKREGTLLIPLADVGTERPEQLEVFFPDGDSSVFHLYGHARFVNTSTREDEFVGWSYWRTGFKGPNLQVIVTASNYDPSKYPGV
tara:strand:+ start:267 stop:572 length:306 start_codon:yes stop_codon:yes gene_type:complete